MSVESKVGSASLSDHIPLSCVRVKLKTAKKGCPGSGRCRQWASVLSYTKNLSQHHMQEIEILLQSLLLADLNLAVEYDIQWAPNIFQQYFLLFPVIL